MQGPFAEPHAGGKILVREEGKGSGEEDEEEEDLTRLERFTGFGGKQNTEASVEEEIA